MYDRPTINQDPIGFLRFGQDDPNHPLNHTKARRATLKITLPCDKFEELIKLAYIDDTHLAFMMMMMVKMQCMKKN